jgi:tetratricopeptide (TPR) repeat protein
MEALAVYHSPVSEVAVDFLLQPYDPTTNAAPILTRLVSRSMCRRDGGLFYVHPIDRAYALDQIPDGDRTDTPPVYTESALRSRAADYFAQIRTSRDTWRSIDDLRPQLAEFELRCDNGDYDTAASVLADIDLGYLNMWGHYRVLVELHTRILGRITDPGLRLGHLTGLGSSYSSLGEHPKAIDLHEEALAIAREIGDRGVEGMLLGNLGTCYWAVGDYPKAIDLDEQALTIAREIGDRRAEGDQLCNLGPCYSALGDYPQAIDLDEQALAIARDIGNRIAEGAVLANLGWCYFWLGDYPQAIDLNEQALAIGRDLGHRYLEAYALGYLGRVWLAAGEAPRAVSSFGEAIAIADATRDVEPGAVARSGLARALLESGDAASALTVSRAGQQTIHPPEHATLCLMEGVALLDLDDGDGARRSFAEAVMAAEEMVAAAANNVTALDARALALCGLALTGDRTRVTEVIEAFTKARGVTTAPGVVAEVSRLFDILARHDHADALGAVRDALSAADA